MNHRKWLRLKETLLQSAHNNLSEDGINEGMEKGWEEFHASSRNSHKKKITRCVFLSNGKQF
jgi:hypothetical protein